MIATNCDSVEVYVGGTYLTTGTPNTQAFPNLAYPPVSVDLSSVDGTGLPDLRLDGYLGAQLVSSLHMSSDPGQDRLVLSIEDASIQGDGSDATRFTFRDLDAYGNQRPYPSGGVTLALTGPATLIGDNPFDFATYGGVGGAFIRSLAGGSGVVTVTATHPSLGQASGSVIIDPVPAPGGGTGPVAPSPPAPSPTPTTPTTATTPTPPMTHAKAPKRLTKASVRSALAAVLSPRGADGRIAKLLQHSGYTFRFDAPSAGRLVIDWYYVPRGAHVAKSRGPTKVLVAATSASIKRPGPGKIKLRLTARGRSLLRRAKHERLTVKASFTPAGQSTTTSSSVINLKR